MAKTRTPFRAKSIDLLGTIEVRFLIHSGDLNIENILSNKKDPAGSFSFLLFTQKVISLS